MALVRTRFDGWAGPDEDVDLGGGDATVRINTGLFFLEADVPSPLS